MPFLFSYGTLQHADVQVSTFGRLLQGAPDRLVGFVESSFTVDDPEFVTTSGKADHTMARFTGNESDVVHGTVLDITELELDQADQYEPAGYTRVSVRLASGLEAWVYAGAPQA